MQDITPGHEPTDVLEALSLPMTLRVAAMLDLDPVKCVIGGSLPRGWHFPLLASTTRRSELRADGFPGFGVPMPRLGLDRLMLRGRTVSYVEDLAIGDNCKRVSEIVRLEQKGEGENVAMLVSIRHQLFGSAAAPAVIETQDYVLMSAANRYSAPQGQTVQSNAAPALSFTPDAMLLFQYSALGFNSHRIHLDRGYARDVEGYPDLVVNGGLTTLLVTEFVRQNLGLRLVSLKVRNLVPFFCDRPMHFFVERKPNGWDLRIFDDTGRLGLVAEVEAG